MKIHRLPLLACAALWISGSLAARAEPWGTLGEDDGGFLDPAVVYKRVAFNVSQLQPGTKIHLEITCPKANYFAVDVYDQKSGDNIAHTADRAISGEADRSKPPCEPGSVFQLDLTPRASAPEAKGELVVAQLTDDDRVIEVWFRAYMGQDVKPPKISLIGKDGRDLGEPAMAPVFEFPTEMSLKDAILKRSQLPPAPRGGSLVFLPTMGSWIFPNGYPYLVSRLEGNPPVFGDRPFEEGTPGERFAIVKFKPPTTPGGDGGGIPQVRYWSICLVDAPSTLLLEEGDGGRTSINHRTAKISKDGTVTLVLGSPAVVKYAREQGLNALPVTYPKPLVAMPVLMYRQIPEDPDFKQGIPTEKLWKPGQAAPKSEDFTRSMGDYAPSGKFHRARDMESVIQAALKDAEEVKAALERKAAPDPGGVLEKIKAPPF